MKITSKDGTTLAVERSGSGPALVMIDPALGFSGFDNIRRLGELLAADFTVHTYDRRGRGSSGDTTPYAVEREIDDLAAIIEAAGGSAHVYGFSSGALLALHAAAAGVPIERMALFEPPVRAEGEPPDTAFTAGIAELLAAGDRDGAVRTFLTAIGVPAEILAEMAPLLPALAPVAPTLLYDCAISDTLTFDTLRAVPTSTVVLDSTGTTEDITSGTAAVARALPAGILRRLAGGWHGVPPEALAPVVAEFLLSPG
ncbi:alpha/beta fold hydrolase [Pseudonocardia sp. TRM90224]|uniref:alpha/beta fold hydrolase n=1 Tax=Pseudonocardia sp. TRM90224 TaxID=2812678 RepID=UPI001E39E28E|nr:alpha/beta hydrolase [Pseudonocardia sp. TRM90224]